MERGRAIVVAGTPEKGAVIAKAKELFVFARAHDYRRDELMALLRDLA
jgi:hypothetical protein